LKPVLHRGVLSARLKDNIISLFAIQAVTYLVPLVSLPYLVRVLGTDAFGRVTFAIACTQYFTVLTEYGFNLSATRRAAVLEGNMQELSRLLTATTSLRVLFCVFGFLCLNAIVAWLPRFEEDRALYVFAYVAVVGQAIFPGWLFQGLGRMPVLTACTVAGQLISLAALFTFVKTPSDYRIAAGLQGGAYVVAGLLAWAFLRRKADLDLLWPGWSYIAKVLREGLDVFVSTAAMSLYTTTNIVVLGLLTSPRAVAYFAVADKLIRACHGLTAPISQAVYPHIARLTTDSTDRAFTFIRGLLRWQSALALLVSGLVFAFAGPLVQLLFGSGFAESTLVVRIMAFLPLIVACSNVLGVQTMLNFGMNRSFTRIIVLSGLINLALLFVLATRYAAEGAALAVVATEVAVVALMSVSLHRAGLFSRLFCRAGA
jgi:polysaccharide transporter, PST family